MLPQTIAGTPDAYQPDATSPDNIAVFEVAKRHCDDETLLNVDLE
jgi:hypothetical protein